MEKKLSLLLQALGQLFLERRGILKMGQVWLPLSLILFSGTRLPARAELHASLFLLYAVVSKGLATILINDLTDREIDKRAGKERWVSSLPLAAGITIPVLLLASGFPALVLAGGGPLVLASFTASATLGILYSLKPVRFKERGLWGLLAYSLSAAVLHGLVPWTLFRPALWLLPFLFVVVTGEKLVQMLFHQVLDFDSDREEKVGSFAVTVGRDRAGRTLRWILSFALAADSVLLICVLSEVAKEQPPFLRLIGPACLLAVLAAGLYSRIISKRTGTSTTLTERLPWPYLGISYVLFYLLPPLLFLTLALRRPEIWILAALSALWLLGVSLNIILYDRRK